MPWLQDMRWPEVAEYLEQRQIILIPAGSTEQHGRHAPLGTDAFVASQLAEDAIQKTQVVSAPPLYFGWAPHHLALPGTISIEPFVLSSLLFQEIRSLAMNGFRQFVVINGHRETNLAWMQIGAEQSQRELGVRVVLFDAEYMAKEILAEIGFGPVGHAEEIETSHMMYIRPELVRLDQAVDCTDPEPPFYHVDPRSPEDTLAYFPGTLAAMKARAAKTGGSSGTPSKSRTDLGRRVHDHLVARLVQVIEGLENGTI